MIADVMAAHELVAIDDKERCSCGTASSSQLEHLGDVALAAMGATRKVGRRADLPRAVDVPGERISWAARQLRAQNLETFRHMTEVWPEPRAKRQRGPQYDFTPTQLAIADRVFNPRSEAA